MKLKISVLILALFGAVLSLPRPKFERDAEELANLFEGDIQLTPEQERELFSKNGHMNFKYRWADKIVPYHINESHFNQAQVDYIREALDVLESVTCLKFVPRTDEENYVYVKGDGGGCSSMVGMIGGRQNLNLQSNYDIEVGCFRKFTIVHEFLHALGFYHQQSASNRDEYVRIDFDKIQEGTLHNFNKYGWNVISDFGVPYDYGSVLHYGKTAFSIDGSQTIFPLQNKTAFIGQRTEISRSDILKVNRMYDCGMEPEPEPTTPEPERPQKPNIKDIIDNVGKFISSILQGIFGSNK